MGRQPLDLALAIEEGARAVPGIAGLDPKSFLSTRAGDARVRGAWVRPEEDGSVDLELEVAGLVGARLPQAVEELKAACAGAMAAHGWLPGRIDVTVSDLVPERLAPQIEPEAPARREPAPPPPPPDHPAAGRRRPQRVELPIGSPQARTVMVITVEVVEER